jgi:hypothetical protein
MRRDKNDKRWADLVKLISSRDKTCRLIRTLSYREFIILQRNAGILLARCDPAHVFGVGSHPKDELIYNPKNVYLLNRYSHEMIDNCKNPITGINITKEERELWWIRIIGDTKYKELYKIAYGVEDEQNFC